MRLDAILADVNLPMVPEIAKRAEQEGFDTIWTQETTHDPFLPHALIAEHTTTLKMGTGIAVSFSRSPMNLAYSAWDLAGHSNGRFILGLGTQVKAHIERRFGMEWPDSVTGKLREQIQAIRAIWNCWQTGEKLNFRGKYFTFSLMSPFFTPQPIQFPNIPISIAGVNLGLAELAGECADGFMIHPFHSAGYLRDVLLPALKTGTERSGRGVEKVKKFLTVFCAITEEEKEACRAQIAFYASTPTYKKVLEHHDRGDVGDVLSRMAARGKWEDMSNQIDDAFLGQICVIAKDVDDLADKLREKYLGLADSISIYKMYKPGECDHYWRRLVRKFHS